MEFISGIYSDIGNVKEVNQDAALVRQAETEKGKVLFAVVCDGMGGLQKGELASATVIVKMSEWFENSFPDLLYCNFTPAAIKESWTQLLVQLDNQISAYGNTQGIQLGTTITALLLVNDAYYICNVGDSRIYYLNEEIQQVTRDQSYVQREIDMGRMTEEEALLSEQRSVLLQCIGVGAGVIPDFYVGEYAPSTAFLLCSDGFRHVISSQEMLNELHPQDLGDENDIMAKLKKLTDAAKLRREDDNITAVLIHII